MQIVIKIPDRKWEIIQDGEYCGLLDKELYEAIKNGIVIPEDHGDLIDRYDLISEAYEIADTKYCNHFVVDLDDIRNAKTVI